MFQQLFIAGIEADTCWKNVQLPMSSSPIVIATHLRVNQSPFASRPVHRHLKLTTSKSLLSEL
jgi:hypothetical protein